MTRAKKDRTDEYSRNRRLEAEYKFDRRGERSVLAYVSRYEDELVEAFESWRLMHQDGSRSDALLRWEAERFGATLYPAAHGVMAAAVRRGKK